MSVVPGTFHRMNPFRLSSRLSVSARPAPGGSAAGASRGVSVRAALAGGRGSPDPAASRGSGESGAAASAAVAVPWRVTVRSNSGVLEVEQCGESPLHAVRFSLAGGGLLGLSLPRTVYPGERVRVVLRGSRAEGAREARDAVLVLRWFQPDGRELLWPIPL